MLITFGYKQTKKLVLNDISEKKGGNNSDERTEIFEEEPQNNVIFMEDNKSIIFKKDGKIIGSFLKQRFFKYLTLSDKDPRESDDYIIEQYLVKKNHSEKNTNQYLFTLIESSPLLTNIKTLIDLNNILYEYEKSTELNNNENNENKFNEDNIADFMILLLKFTLESIGVELKKISDKNQREYYNNYSLGLLFRINEYIKKKINNTTTRINYLEKMFEKRNLLVTKINSVFWKIQEKNRENEIIEKNKNDYDNRKFNSLSNENSKFNSLSNENSKNEEFRILENNEKMKKGSYSSGILNIDLPKKQDDETKNNFNIQGQNNNSYQTNINIPKNKDSLQINNSQLNDSKTQNTKTPEYRTFKATNENAENPNKKSFNFLNKTQFPDNSKNTINVNTNKSKDIEPLNYVSVEKLEDHMNKKKDNKKKDYSETSINKSTSEK